MPDNASGLAAALVKFQGSGFAVPRTRKVEVETKSGGKYSFDYAPHELIVAAVRKPLEDCGLAVSQTLSVTPDGRPALRTMLLHSSGERMDDVFPLPLKDGMSAQEIGSAITYIRRYALSAILGLATEDDDDGNRASGNRVTNRQDKGEQPTIPGIVGTREHPAPLVNGDGGLVGKVEVAKDSPDFLPHQGPDGAVLSFKLVSKAGGIKVIARGSLAEVISLAKDQTVGEQVTCWGRISDDTFTPKGARKPITYQVLALERIKTPSYTLPAPDDVLEEPSDDVELFDEAESEPLGLVS